MDNFIQIVDVEEDVIQWSIPKNPDTNEKSESVLLLKVLPKDVKEGFQKRATQIERKRGQRQEIFDGERFANLCLAYAITGWQNIRSMKDSHIDVPFTDETRDKLPEWIKIEVMRICVGREWKGDGSDTPFVTDRTTGQTMTATESAKSIREPTGVS